MPPTRLGFALGSILGFAACSDAPSGSSGTDTDSDTSGATDTGQPPGTGPTPDTGEAPTTSGASVDDTGDSTSTTGADTTTSADESSSSTGEEPIEPSSNWCDRVVTGTAGGDATIDLAVAHAFIRLFGAEADYPTVDAALASALDADDALDVLDLYFYDDPLQSLCILDANAPAALGPASVETTGSIAWVRPGTGDVTLPPDAEVVVLDLRDLPNVPELPEALTAALAPALATAFEPATQRLRRHDGHVDQMYSATNVYTTDVVDIPAVPIEPTGTADLEIVVVTGEQLVPAAAALAGSLRLQNRAWLVGHDVFAEVAESSWHAIGDSGAIWRSRELYESGTRWPGLVVADTLTNTPEDVVEQMFPAGTPTDPVVDEGDRSPIVDYDPFSYEYPEDLGLGEIRSALLTAYGITELFFPYFDDVGHDTDERLAELLAEVTPSDVDDRALMRERLGRFANALSDGHGFVRDYFYTPPTGRIAARFEALDGYPVVRRADQAGLELGDTIIEVAGEPVLDWYDARYPRVSAASDGYRHDLVTRILTRTDDPLEVTTESAAGVQQTVVLVPVAGADGALGPTPVNRPTGWLADIGAPTVQYLNMSNTSLIDALVAIEEAIALPATGMVVDMRGYPIADHYSIAQRLIPGQFESPIFEVPIRTGADIFEETSDSYPFAGIQPYDGPMVLIVGNHCVSAAENFSIMLVGADRATVVGQQSASTNGNITGINLPGGFAVSFTGMRVLYPDGSTFHGVGIVPDVEVAIDPLGFAAGDDPELLIALTELP